MLLLTSFASIAYRAVSSAMMQDDFIFLFGYLVILFGRFSNEIISTGDGKHYEIEGKAQYASSLIGHSLGSFQIFSLETRLGKLGNSILWKVSVIE